MNKRQVINWGHKQYSKLAYRFPLGYSPLPPLVIYVTTLRCNLRCKMCHLYGEYGIPPNTRGELSLLEAKRMIDNIKTSYRHLPYLPFIGMSGGEPFLRKDIFEIAEYMKKSGFRFSFTTNLSTLNNKQIERLIQVKPADLRVSLDGPEDVHDRIRGVKGTFEKVIKTIKTIRNSKEGKKIPIRINCTISESNVETLPEMIDIAKELNASLNYQYTTFIDKKHADMQKNISAKYFNNNLDNYRGFLKMPKNKIVKLVDQIKKIKEKAKRLNLPVTFLPNLKMDEIKRYYSNLDGYVHSKRCNFPWGSAKIWATGDVYPCFRYSFGNIKKEKFSAIWNSKKARYFRVTLKKFGLFPACLRCCRI